MIDGGFGGTDTIVYSGVTAQSALLGAAGSGSVTFANPNGSTLNFENMEPFEVGGGVQVINRSVAVTAAANKDVTVSNQDGSLRLNINGADSDIALTESKVWLYLGDSANNTTISSLPNPAGFSLMVDAGEEIAVNSSISVSGTLGLSAEDINIGASAAISALSIDIKAIDWSRASLDAAAANADGDGNNATLSVSAITSATITIAGQLTATNGAVTVASYAANTVKAYGKASTAVRTITTTLNNTSTVSVTGTVSGSSVNIAANTDVNVDIMLTEVPIPNFLGLAEINIPTSIFTPIPTAGFITLPQTMIDAILYPNHTRDANGVWTEDATGNVVAAPTPRPSITSFDAAFTAALESGQIAMDDIRMLMSQYQAQLQALPRQCRRFQFGGRRRRQCHQRDQCFDFHGRADKRGNRVWRDRDRGRRQRP